MTWDDLPGAKKDVTAMEARLRAEGYQVEVIENSADILPAVQEVMNKTPVSSVTHLQVLYVGKLVDNLWNWEIFPSAHQARITHTDEE